MKRRGVAFATPVYLWEIIYKDSCRTSALIISFAVGNTGTGTFSLKKGSVHV